MQTCLTEKLGKSSAVFLQQLHYWLTSKKPVGVVADDKLWIYNTAATWGQQLCMSARQVRRIIQKLEDLGLIIVSKLSKKKSDRTNWYTINYKKLKKFLPSLSWTEQKTVSSATKSHHRAAPKIMPEHMPEAAFQADKMSLPLGQNVLMYIGTETTPESETKELDQPSPAPTTTQQVPSSGFKNNLAKELLEIWNQEVGSKTITSGMTKQRAKYLVAAYKIKFGASTDNWKAYCQAIASSEFLVKAFHQKYSLSLEWALKFDNMQKILEGQFNVNMSFFAKAEPIISKDSLTKELGQLPESEGISKLIDAMGVAEYKSWFYDTKPQIKTMGTSLAFFFNSKFVTDYVTNHFGEMMEKILGTRVTIGCVDSNFHCSA